MTGRIGKWGNAYLKSLVLDAHCFLHKVVLSAEVEHRLLDRLSGLLHNIV